MNFTGHELRNSFVIVAFLGVMVLTQSCYSQAKSDPLQQHIERVKKLHKFNEWAGKSKMPGRKIDKLLMDERFFRSFSKETKIYTPKSEREKHLNLTVCDISTNLDVSIGIHVTESPFVAHELMICGMALATAPLPLYKRADPNDPNEPLNIGDVCFGPARPWIPENCEKPVLRELHFSRDNVLVHLRNSFPEGAKRYPDLREIALLIDVKLKSLSKP